MDGAFRHIRTSSKRRHPRPECPLGRGDTPRSSLLPDDREAIGPDDRLLLVAEDDPAFVEILLGMGRDHGFKVLSAQGGEEALELALLHKPQAITLDIRLPGAPRLSSAFLRPLSRTGTRGSR